MLWVSKKMKKEYPFTIPTIDAEVDSNGYKINLKTLQQESLEELIDQLPLDKEINFFDYQGHEYQSDDYGLYTRVQKYKNSFAFMGGNHGRSSNWKRIFKDELIPFITRNVRQKDAFLSISSNILKVDDWHESYLSEIKRK
jgi:hypothetical protein